MSYFSPDSRSYFNSASHYNSSYYNDMYRSFNNLRQSQQQSSSCYQQPLYVSTIPFSLRHHNSSSSYDRPKYDTNTNNRQRNSSTSHLVVQSNKEDTKETGNNQGIGAKKRDGSYESVYNPSRSSTPPPVAAQPTHSNTIIINPSSSSSNSSSTSTLSPSPNSTPSPTASNSSYTNNNINNNNCDFGKQNCDNDTNDLTASATSNIQLNCTDDLTTQVDYYLNEVDYRMICRGKQIELESFELSSRGGLISKCLYLNDLLNEASMNESLFEADPIFMTNGKATLLFGCIKDSEEFALHHSQKFNVQFTHRQTPPQNTNSNNKKNVSFIENNTNDSFTDYPDIDSRNSNKSILKQNNSFSSISPKSTESSDNNKSDASILVSANAAKTKKTEGYEILTIKAKLKQRVGQNRTKAVELHDIDSIMRNVVTIIQDEFMKRFPSGPSIPVTTAIKSN